MAQFGWAYINCADKGSSGSGSAGPPYSLQFVTQSGGGTTGSSNLTYYTASYYSYPPSTMVLSGNLIVTGAISASIYHIQSIATIDATGSTYFGDDVTDIHSRTGSLEVFNDSSLVFKVRPASGQTAVNGFVGAYSSSGDGVEVLTASRDTLVIGVTNTTNTTICMPSASSAGSGSLLVIKDQVDRTAGTSKVYVSGSPGSPALLPHETIDGSNYYILSGTFPAINLYSDGASWWIF